VTIAVLAASTQVYAPAVDPVGTYPGKHVAHALEAPGLKQPAVAGTTHVAPRLVERPCPAVAQLAQVEPAGVHEPQRGTATGVAAVERHNVQPVPVTK